MNALKVYIAGQITGLKNYKDKFNKASKAYSTAGFSVLNPATLKYAEPVTLTSIAQTEKHVGIGTTKRTD